MGGWLNYETAFLYPSRSTSRAMPAFAMTLNPRKRGQSLIAYVHSAPGPHEALERLQSEFPGLAATQPMACDVRQQLHNLGLLPHGHVTKALRIHARSHLYLDRSVEGARRLNLDGSFSGELVTKEQAEQAVKLRQLVLVFEATVPKSRNTVVLNDFASHLHVDTTGLGEVEFMANTGDMVVWGLISSGSFRKAQAYVTEHPGARVFFRRKELETRARVVLHCLPPGSAAAQPDAGDPQ